MNTLHMAIGVSGAGKSTLLETLRASHADLRVFSLDALRHEWYHPTDYKLAWSMANEDSSFSSRANARFIETVDAGGSVYVDNTNLTPKRRKFYLEHARKRGYRTVGHLLLVPLEVLIERQYTRGDKCVPEEAVRRQWMSLVHPLPGEFDEVNVLEYKQ